MDFKSRGSVSFAGTIGWWIGATFVLAACGLRPPVLDPLPLAPSVHDRDIRVEVRPLDTRLGAEDRRRYGVDVSAYLVAFLVRVDNRTARSLSVDLQSSVLEEASGRVSPVLTDAALVRLYRRGGAPEHSIEVVAKAPSVVKRELAAIRAMRMAPTRLESGEVVEGVLLFEPAALPCGRSTLKILGVTVIDDPRELAFDFPMTTCPMSGSGEREPGESAPLRP
ncbi:MAG: hypothetical protein ABIO65_00975 [Nitrospiria bacterium]